jgi:hypothetical protein
LLAGAAGVAGDGDWSCGLVCCGGESVGTGGRFSCDLRSSDAGSGGAGFALGTAEVSGGLRFNLNMVGLAESAFDPAMLRKLRQGASHGPDGLPTSSEVYCALETTQGGEKWR